MCDLPDWGGSRGMIEAQTPRGVGDPEMGPTRSGRLAFNRWLQVQLKARRLTQRQLAQQSGVDHSTISRLLRGDRVPSLRTATRLASGLGVTNGLGRLDDQSLGRTGSPAAWVEYALGSDDLLTETEVREIMDVYLAARLRRHRRVATPAPGEATGKTPAPIVIQVPGVRPGPTSDGRCPDPGRDLRRGRT